MEARISKDSNNLAGRVILPLSKSINNRLLMLAYYLGIDLDEITVSESSDSTLLFSILKQLENLPQGAEIDVKDAGTPCRFLLVALAFRPGTWILKGTERMHQRPIEGLVRSLKNNGVRIEYLEKDGCLPLRIEGTQISNSDLSFDIASNESSQYVSAFLLLSAITKRSLQVTYPIATHSHSYIEMTMSIIQKIGASLQSTKSSNTRTVAVKWTKEPNAQEIDTLNEADWSAASYIYSAASLHQIVDLEFPNLKFSGLQGDQITYKLFEMFGLKSVEKNSGVKLAKSEMPIYGTFCIDLASNPDLALTIIPLCAVLALEADFKGLSLLQFKESPRISAMNTNLVKFGWILTENEEVYELRRNPAEGKTEIDTFSDHRVAMGFAALSSSQGMLIRDMEVVSKSFPKFWERLSELGYLIERN